MTFRRGAGDLGVVGRAALGKNPNIFTVFPLVRQEASEERSRDVIDLLRK
jgi:hypothetical protein